MNTKTLGQIKDKYYGQVGTPERDRIEKELAALRIGFKIRNARESLDMTQEQLAEKVGTKKSYISRLENGKCDIQLSTLYKIFEFGLGRRVNLLIN